MVLKSQKGY